MFSSGSTIKTSLALHGLFSKSMSGVIMSCFLGNLLLNWIPSLFCYGHYFDCFAVSCLSLFITIWVLSFAHSNVTIRYHFSVPYYTVRFGAANR